MPNRLFSAIYLFIYVAFQYNIQQMLELCVTEYFGVLVTVTGNVKIVSSHEKSEKRAHEIIIS